MHRLLRLCSVLRKGVRRSISLPVNTQFERSRLVREEERAQDGGSSTRNLDLVPEIRFEDLERSRDCRAVRRARRGSVVVRETSVSESVRCCSAGQGTGSKVVPQSRDSKVAASAGGGRRPPLACFGCLPLWSVSCAGFWLCTLLESA